MRVIYIFSFTNLTVAGLFSLSAERNNIFFTSITSKQPLYWNLLLFRNFFLIIETRKEVLTGSRGIYSGGYIHICACACLAR